MPTDLKIAIPHVSSRVFKNGESYMVYHVTLEIQNKRWEVEKRFSEFVILANWIKDVFPNVQIPSLPSKINLFSMKEYVAIKRRPILESFLEYIVEKYPDITSTYEFENFFQIDVRIRKPIKLEQPSGVLYLKLVEANFVDKEMRCTADIYQLSSIASENWTFGSHASLNPSSVSTTPKWNQEILFNIKNRNYPLRIQLWSRSKNLMKNTYHCGFVDFDIRKLECNKLYSFVFPLLNSPVKGSSLTLQAFFTPKNIEVSNCEYVHYFRLEVPKMTYKANETISGDIILNVGAPFLIYYSKVILRGYANMKVHNKDESIKKLICEIEKTIIPSSKGTHFDSGTYIYPFDIDLSDELGRTLPFSFKSKVSSISYQLCAVLKRDEEKIEHPIPISIKAIPVTQNTDPFVFKEVKAYDDIKATISFEVHSSESSFYIGSTQNFVIHIQNHPSIISHINVKLVRKMKCVHNNKVINNEYKTISDSIITNVCPIQPESLSIFEIYVNFKKGLLPSISLNTTSHIEISYCMDIFFKLIDVDDDVVFTSVPITLVTPSSVIYHKQTNVFDLGDNYKDIFS